MTHINLHALREKLILAIGYGALTKGLMPVHISMSMARMLLQVIDEAIHIENNSLPNLDQ